MSKIVLITGISSGLGKFMAEYLIDKKNIVYGSSRNDIAVKPGIKLLKLNVIDSVSVQAAIQEVVSREGRIDVLINNAGMGFGGPIEEFTDEEAFYQFDSNIMGVFRMCKAVLPYMRNQKKGLIINISSLGGLMGLPFQGFYSASKFAIEGFSESLRYEVRNFGINVVLVNPGDFNTHFTTNRKTISHYTADSVYNNSFNKTLSIIDTDEKKGLNPNIMARKIEDIIKMKNPATRYVVASAEQKLALFLKKILPGKLFFRIIGSHYGV